MMDYTTSVIHGCACMWFVPEGHNTVGLLPLSACPQPSHSTSLTWWHGPDAHTKTLTENGLSTHLDQQPILGLPFARPNDANQPLVKAELAVALQQALCDHRPLNRLPHKLLSITNPT